ncbi:MAG TPA: aminotransferase class V-fold PLP-dependent enzyme [Burkholderiales bacterium]|jgi:kynureninase|nr:aminotransferase class V-fold PLP-dependent enzyme [Burkholderiales bacterium]
MSAPRLDEAWLARHVWPRFSRVLARKEIYLANHSLGRPPDHVAEELRAAIDAWYSEMDGAWDLWIQGRERFRSLVSQLVAAPRADCIVPKTSAGQGLRAVLNALPGKPRVLTTDAEFDSIDFILRIYRDKGRIELKALPFDSFRFEPCDLVVLSTVAFRTGAIFPSVKNVIEKAHASGALVLLDVYHHAGVLPLDLAALDADFAVGGSYKYLRGGPGACWLYVHPRHHGLRTLDTGWFAKEDVFAYQRPEPPRFAARGDAWLESTPPVLAPFQALAGLEITLQLGVERIREHNLAQKALLKSFLPIEGEGEGHGAFVTLRNAKAKALSAELEKKGVKTDARGEYLRICPDYLNSRSELEAAAAHIAGLIEGERV